MKEETGTTEASRRLQDPVKNVLVELTTFNAIGRQRNRIVPMAARSHRLQGQKFSRNENGRTPTDGCRDAPESSIAEMDGGSRISVNRYAAGGLADCGAGEASGGPSL